MKGKKRTQKNTKKTKNTYTKGELNKLIDSLVHPLSKENAGFMLVDGVLHGIVEQDPPASVRKFVKYNLPKIFEQSTRKRHRKANTQN